VQMMWKVVLQVLAALVTLLIAILDYKWLNEHTLKFRRARGLLLLFILVLLAVSVFVTIQDDQEKEREKEDLTHRLDEITKQLTGGDSYCYIQFAFPVSSDNLIMVWLKNEGDYPLYDTQVRMVDLHKFHNLEWSVPMPEEEVKKAEALFSFGTIGPHNIAELARIETPAELDAYGVNIWIHTRYKEYVQEARFRRFEGRWRLAHRLFEQTDQGQLLIFEEISKEFPSTSSAEEIWEFAPISR
jgi:hypothetical protein